MRLWLMLVLLLSFGALDVYLLTQEPDLDDPQVVEGQVFDALRRMSYSPSNRLANLNDMGLDDAALNEAVRERIAKLEISKAKLVERLKAQPPNSYVYTAFCSSDATQGLPPPYAAIPLLVERGRDGLYVADPEFLSFLPVEGYSEDTARAVYLTWEGRNRSTLMGVAGLLLEKGDLAARRQEVWGGSYLRSARFREVKTTYPRAWGLVVDYFALMHLVTELASEHICGGA